jgi:hypothetical protein
MCLELDYDSDKKHKYKIACDYAKHGISNDLFKIGINKTTATIGSYVEIWNKMKSIDINFNDMTFIFKYLLSKKNNTELNIRWNNIK